ncbi:MAG: hypothetical protein NZM28_06025, partial [Fimbriimonadales bacterium]|nr:hypothetical protein [Fimbriimonadales bacterium]
MVIHQQDSSVESERRYSPEEAGEILKLAANLQDDSFSVEQLRAIAREAGIDDQQLNRAIAQYEQSKRQAAPQNQTGHRGRNRRLIAAAVGIVLAVLLTLVILGGIELPKKSDVDPAVSDAYPASFIGETAPLESDSRTLLASSRSCTVYKAPQNDGVGEQVVIQRRDGSEFVVGNRFSRVVSA